MIAKRLYIPLLVCLISILISGCKRESEQKEPEPVTDSFAKGADVSWLTEMEDAGILFYDKDGNERECLSLLKSLGVNSIRLRVWVNPADGWNNKNDVLLKAQRAADLGMRIMIDFHYSDTWADPAHQVKPVAWQSYDFEDLKTAVTNHTKEVLTALKDANIAPRWVQIGNETGNGMLWDEGKASVNMAKYTALNNTGYVAVKSIFPDAKVIVHLQNGFDHNLYLWLFDGLKSNGGKWDVIGMSLYPETDTWQEYNDNCISNIKDMISRYGKEVMICEVGMPWDDANAKPWLTDLMTRSKAIDKCLGVFYWEPEAHNGWKGYTLGAFDDSGKPAAAMDAFK